jgi:hypothetical protein
MTRTNQEREKGTFRRRKGIQEPEKTNSGKANQVCYTCSCFMYLTDYRERSLKDVITQLNLDFLKSNRTLSKRL